MRLVICLFAFHLAASAQSDAPPDAAAQDRILTLMRQYAASFERPDVSYDETLTFSSRRKHSSPWRKRETLETNWVARGHSEYSRRAGKDGKPIARAKWTRKDLECTDSPLPASGATYEWERWETIGARRLAVFSYKVSPRDTNWITGVVAGVHNLGQRNSSGNCGLFVADRIPLPYSGSIYVDPATGAVWRLAMLTTDFPRHDKIRSASDVTDYGQMPIGTAQYLLPTVRTFIAVRYDGIPDLRADRFYRNYRKFDADSSITYFGADSSITYKK